MAPVSLAVTFMFQRSKGLLRTEGLPCLPVLCAVKTPRESRSVPTNSSLVSVFSVSTSTLVAFNSGHLWGSSVAFARSASPYSASSDSLSVLTIGFASGVSKGCSSVVSLAVSPGSIKVGHLFIGRAWFLH